MRKLKVLELYAGTQSIGKEFRNNDHEVLSVEIQPLEYFGDFANKEGYDKNFLQADLLNIDLKKFVKTYGEFDFVWLSPMCTTHSIAAISHHRVKEESGYLYPKSGKAYLHDAILIKALELVKTVKAKHFIIENPVGGMRKSRIVKDMNRFKTTYCQYGDKRMKPTDFFTSMETLPLRLPCKNGDTCHEAAPRGSRTGTQGLKNNMLRSIIPVELCKHIVEIVENEFKGEKL